MYNVFPDHVLDNVYQHMDNTLGELLVELLVLQKSQCSLECLLHFSCSGFRTVQLDHHYRCILLDTSSDVGETFMDLYQA